MHSLVSADFFVVPTITFRLLFVFVILSHDLAVTANPTAEWTTRQLLEAFPWDSAPRYLLRDRDTCYGKEFHEATGWLGLREVLTAPRSPWQNPYVERLIGTVRRECLGSFRATVFCENTFWQFLRSAGAFRLGPHFFRLPCAPDAY